MVYYAIVKYPIRYGLVIRRERDLSRNLKTVLILQKKAIRTLENLHPQQSCKKRLPNPGNLHFCGPLHQISHPSYWNPREKWTLVQHPECRSICPPFLSHHPVWKETFPHWSKAVELSAWGSSTYMTGGAIKIKLQNFLVSRLVYSVEEFITTMREQSRKQNLRLRLFYLSKFFVFVLFMTLSLYLIIMKINIYHIVLHLLGSRRLQQNHFSRQLSWQGRCSLAWRT